MPATGHSPFYIGKFLSVFRNMDGSGHWLFAQYFPPSGLFSQAVILFFPPSFPLPHNCGAIAPQLWCNCLTTVVQLPHSCGATEISFVKTKRKDKKTSLTERLRDYHPIDSRFSSDSLLRILQVYPVKVQQKPLRHDSLHKLMENRN